MKTKSIISIICAITFTLTGCAIATQSPSSESAPAKVGLTESEAKPIPVKESISDSLKQLFAEKYPQYSSTVSVKIDQETDKYARGMVTLKQGEAGGIFLAVKTGGEWEIVHDGNGIIPCALNKYGFPAEMLSDCAQ